MKTPKLRHFKVRDLGFVQIQGKRYYLGKWGTTECQQKYAAKLAELAATGTVVQKSGSRILLSELIDQYLDWCKGRWLKNGKSGAEIRNLNAALGAVQELYSDLYADEFSPLKLKSVRQVFLDRDYARATVRGHTGRIVRCWGWAQENELVPVTVWQALCGVKPLSSDEVRQPPPIEPVEREVVEKIKPFVSPFIWSMIEFQWWTGCRPGEVCQMRTCDLDMSRSDWTYTPASHKNQHRGHSRIIAIGPRAQEILKPLLRLNTQEYLFQPCESRQWHRDNQRSKSKRVRLARNRPARGKRNNRPGTKFKVASYNRSIAYACDRAGIAHWHPNQLRHSALTRIRAYISAQTGSDEQGLEAARVTGSHKHGTTTEIYALRDESAARRVARQCG